MVLIKGLQLMVPCFKSVCCILQNLLSMCTLLICIICLILLSLASLLSKSPKMIHVVLLPKEKNLIHITNEKFLSTALDSMLIANGFPHFNMTDPRLVQLMKPLAPGYLRIGGNMADRLWFNPDEQFISKSRFFTEADGGECSHNERLCDPFDRPNFTMSATEWKQLNHLAQKSDLTILFDLNCLIRFPNGSWNSKNAEELIRYSAKQNFNIMWQLGNEPNAFRHVFNYEVNATQLAKDFAKLRHILNGFPIYRESKIVGPDTTRPILKHKASMLYLYNFLLTAKDTIDAITWHQYYFNGKNACIFDFLDPNVFNLLETQIMFIKNIVNEANATNKPIWLGETSSAYGGGAPGLSNSYLATFIWLDKLGIAARNGLDVVVRQTLFGSNYPLLDQDFTPLPDWWVSVIYKKLVGPQVVPCYIATSDKVRLYCHCTKKEIFGTYSPFIVIFGVNLNYVSAYVRIQRYRGVLWEYSLTTAENLRSKSIQLNGRTLSLLPNGSLPNIEPLLINSTTYNEMPPYSLVFWIVPIPTSSCVIH